MTARLRAGAVLATVLLCAAIVPACTDDDGDDGAGPTTTSSEATSTTTPVDYSKVSLPAVEGSTTTVVAMGPGGATVEGIAVGPTGPLPGGVVRVERLVGEQVAVVDVLIGPDGRWAVPDILGGRYRVRAWLAPDHAMTEPLIFFLEHGTRQEIELRVGIVGGTVAMAATNPNPPPVGDAASLAVKVVGRVVDDQGVVRSSPHSGVQVRLTGTGRWTVRSPNPVFTDGTGTATWQVECLSVGTQPLSIVLDGSDVLPLDVPACVAEASDPSSTTTTTSGSGGTTSTTTTTSSTTTTTEDD